VIRTIYSSSSFLRQFKKITKQNSKLKEEIIETIEILRNDPFANVLQTHRVNPKVGGVRWASRVNGDIRIIWDFSNNNVQIIELWDIGGHSGSKKVYK